MENFITITVVRVLSINYEADSIQGRLDACVPSDG